MLFQRGLFTSSICLHQIGARRAKAFFMGYLFEARPAEAFLVGYLIEASSLPKWTGEN